MSILELKEDHDGVATIEVARYLVQLIELGVAPSMLSDLIQEVTREVKRAASIEYVE